MRLEKPTLQEGSILRGPRHIEPLVLLADCFRFADESTRLV